MTTDYAAIRNLYTKNAAGLRGLLAKAERAPQRKVNGYTIDQLRETLARYERFATLPDAEMETHLAACRASVSTRLAQIIMHG